MVVELTELRADNGRVVNVSADLRERLMPVPNRTRFNIGHDGAKAEVTGVVESIGTEKGIDDDPATARPGRNADDGLGGNRRPQCTGQCDSAEAKRDGQQVRSAQIMFRKI